MAALSKLGNLPLQLLTAFAAYTNPTTMTMQRFRWILFWFMILINRKVIPFVWHSRFYSALFRHLLFRRQKLPNPAHLFAPVVISSRSPLYECDFNFHKSNSTYFADLDIARTHLVTHIIKKSLRIRRQRGERPMYVALGGVCCLFRREIKPYEKYEMWTRVLAWDNKWFWVVSHFVSKPNKGGERKVFASALSKYVFKSDRKTIPPVVVLEESGVLPPIGTSLEGKEFGEESLLRSAEAVGDSILHTRLQHLSSANASTAEPSRASSPAPQSQAWLKENKVMDDGSVVDIGSLKSSASDGKGSSIGKRGSGEEYVPQLGADRIDVWDWDTVERVRLHGLEIANNMLRLDALENEFENGNGRSGIKGKAPMTF